jgi:hypothetical protein
MLEQLANLAAGLSLWQAFVLAAAVATIVVRLFGRRRR